HRADDDEHDQQREGQVTAHVQERNSADRDTAERIGDNAGYPETGAVDELAAEEDREHARQYREEPDQADPRRAPGQLEDEPRDRYDRDRLGDERQGVRGKEREDRKPCARHQPFPGNRNITAAIAITSSSGSSSTGRSGSPQYSAIKSCIRA